MIDPSQLTDAQLLAEWDALEPESDSDREDALSDEILRRGLDV